MTIIKLPEVFIPEMVFECHPKTWSIQSQDDRSLRLREVDLEKVELISVLRDGEDYLDYFNFEMYSRLKAFDGIRLDGRVLQALMDYPGDPPIPESWNEKCKSWRTGIYFPGSVLLHHDNFSSLAGMSQEDGYWSAVSHNPNLGCTSCDWFAILRL